jgi:hypothetical protein
VGKPLHAQIQRYLRGRSQLDPKMSAIHSEPPGAAPVIDTDFSELVLAEGSGLDQHGVAVDGVRIDEHQMGTIRTHLVDERRHMFG